MMQLPNMVKESITRMSSRSPRVDVPHVDGLAVHHLDPVVQGVHSIQRSLRGACWKTTSANLIREGFVVYVLAVLDLADQRVHENVQAVVEVLDE